MILGIDEVGRGAWAGPLVVGAVVLGGAHIDGITDSKLLSKKRREQLDGIIRSSAAGAELGWVWPREIDEIGLASALRLATRRAVEGIQSRRIPFHEIIIDGTVNFLSETPLAGHVTTMKKADLLVPSVSAASIIAKVARDQYMTANDDQYGFAAHVGYGTRSHRAAIALYGVNEQHRLSIAPLAHFRSSSPAVNGTSTVVDQTSRAIGDASESAAVDELCRRGHKILHRNWRTKWCEIDVVSSKGGTVYFTEVKHRKDSRAGSGIDAVTPKKVEQMEFAARLYVQRYRLTNTDLRLIVVATAGREPHIVEFLEIA